MEAIGTQVYTVIMPLILVTGLALFTYQRQILAYFRRVYVYIFGNQQLRQGPINRNPAFGDGQCPICLSQPKKFQVSSTCGHSFCCECIFTIYERNDEKILCPLCRRQITTLFKSFHDEEEPAELRVVMITKMNEYNDQFDDNRPLIRRLQQFPSVLRRIGRLARTPRFWVLFVQSMYFFRIILLVLTYLILPLDLIPERMFGFIGFIDDFFVLIFLVLLGMVLFAPIFIRIRANR